jgi:hypothetical protein
VGQDSNNRFVSSREGAAILGVPRQSFFYYAESREVTRREKEDAAGKDRYEYSYDDLIRIKEDVQASKYKKRQASTQQKTQSGQAQGVAREGATDWASREDLPRIYVLDCDVYGIEYSVPSNKTLTWLEKNNRCIRVLFDSKNRRDIWGCITLLPMEDETIYALLRGDLSEQQIEPEHILAYESGKEYSCYVTSCVIKSERRSSFRLLFNSVTDYWCNRPEVRIRKLYGFAVGAPEESLEGDAAAEENDGLRLIKKLYFSPRYDIGDNAWELDLERYNPSLLIQHYQRCVRKKRGLGMHYN